MTGTSGCSPLQLAVAELAALKAQLPCLSAHHYEAVKVKYGLTVHNGSLRRLVAARIGKEQPAHVVWDGVPNEVRRRAIEMLTLGSTRQEANQYLRDTCPDWPFSPPTFNRVLRAKYRREVRAGWRTSDSAAIRKVSLFGDFTKVHRPNQLWHLDTTGLGVASMKLGGRGSQQLIQPCVVSVTDRFDNAFVANLTKGGSPSAADTIRVLIEAFRVLGVPERIMVDRGAEFLNENVVGLLSELNVALHVNDEGNSPANGKIERGAYVHIEPFARKHPGWTGDGKAEGKAPLLGGELRDAGTVLTRYEDLCAEFRAHLTDKLVPRLRERARRDDIKKLSEASLLKMLSCLPYDVESTTPQRSGISLRDRIRIGPEPRSFSNLTSTDRSYGPHGNAPADLQELIGKQVQAHYVPASANDVLTHGYKVNDIVQLAVSHKGKFILFVTDKQTHDPMEVANYARYRERTLAEAKAAKVRAHDRRNAEQARRNLERHGPNEITTTTALIAEIARRLGTPGDTIDYGTTDTVMHHGQPAKALIAVVHAPIEPTITQLTDTFNLWAEHEPQAGLLRLDYPGTIIHWDRTTRTLTPISTTTDNTDPPDT